MAAKEPTVEEKQVLGAVSNGQWHYIQVDRDLYREWMAEIRGHAEAKRAAAEKAWDEGYTACIYDPIHGPKSPNPHRLPAKGDGT
jgi:hypothetical protein